LSRREFADLKMLGQYAYQLIYNKTKDAIATGRTYSSALLRAEKCNKKGEIEAYYYSDNWQDTKKFEPEADSGFWIWR